MIRGKIILVTGGAGAIGSNLVHKLGKHNKVVVIDDLSSGTVSNLEGLENIEFIEGDILEDHLLDQAFNFNPNVVFHLASFFANKNSMDHPTKDLNVNGMGILRVLHKSVYHKVQKFIYTSSSCVYGQQDGEMIEDKVGNLDTPYVITKMLGEHYTQYFHRHYHLNTTILRLFNCYGPGEFPGRYRNVIPNFIWSAINAQSLTVTGDGSDTRTFTYVEDIIEGLIKAAVTQNIDGDIINIGSTEETDIICLVEIINNTTRNNAKINFIPRRPWDSVFRRKPSLKKAQRLLQWNAKFTLDDGISKYILWMKDKMSRGKLEVK